MNQVELDITQMLFEAFKKYISVVAIDISQALESNPENWEFAIDRIEDKMILELRKTERK